MNILFRGMSLSIHIKEYANGRTAICLFTENGEPYMVATVNMPEIKLDDDEVIIKNYSENTGILDALISSGIISAPVHFVDTGFVFSPICKLIINKDI